MLRGARPIFLGATDWAEERSLIVTQIADWGSPRDGSVAICVPTSELATDVLAALEAQGIPAVEMGPDGPGRNDGVHVGTMHRFKGLEYQKMIVAGVTDALVPRHMVNRYRDLDPGGTSVNDGGTVPCSSSPRPEPATSWRCSGTAHPARSWLRAAGSRPDGIA